MKTEEAREYSFDEEASDIFNTPIMRCLQMKKEFLRKARNYKFLGRNGSKQRVFAMDTLFNYCKESIQQTKNDDQLYHKMWLEIHNLVLQEQPILPVPKTVREKLSTVVIDMQNDEFDEPDHDDSNKVNIILEELEKLRDASLSQYESREWSRFEQFNENSFHLRKLRKRIYDGVNVGFNIMEYDFAVSKFLEEFQETLTPEEVKIWKQKQLDTIKFVEEFLGCPVNDLSADFGGSCAFANPVDAQEDSKSVEILEEKFELSKTTEITETILIPKVKGIIDAAKVQESQLENLPNVPEGEDPFDSQNSVEKDIEARLLKLKFFRKTWCSEPFGETEPVEMTPTVVAKLSQPKRNVAKAIEVPISRSKEDVEEFNKWYLKQIGVILPPPSNVFAGKDEDCGWGSKVPELEVNPTVPRTQLQTEIESVSPEQVKNVDEKPILMPGINMDEQMAYAMPSPHTSNLVEGSSRVSYNITMENVLVLFLAILKMIHLTQPKLSYVPAVFPTHSKFLPNPSVPSSACGPTMTHVEVRLTGPSCQGMRQVVSDLTRGYLSQLSERFWEKVQRKKNAAGLRIIEVGEMLLS